MKSPWLYARGSLADELARLADQIRPPVRTIPPLGLRPNLANPPCGQSRVRLARATDQIDTPRETAAVATNLPSGLHDLRCRARKSRRRSRRASRSSLPRYSHSPTYRWRPQSARRQGSTRRTRSCRPPGEVRPAARRWQHATREEFRLSPVVTTSLSSGLNRRCARSSRRREEAQAACRPSLPRSARCRRSPR